MPAPADKHGTDVSGKDGYQCNGQRLVCGCAGNMSVVAKPWGEWALTPRHSETVDVPLDLPDKQADQLGSTPKRCEEKSPRQRKTTYATTSSNGTEPYNPSHLIHKVNTSHMPPSNPLALLCGSRIQALCGCCSRTPLHQVKLANAWFVETDWENPECSSDPPHGIDTANTATSQFASDTDNASSSSLDAQANCDSPPVLAVAAENPPTGNWQSAEPGLWWLPFVAHNGTNHLALGIPPPQLHVQTTAPLSSQHLPYVCEKL